MTICLRHDCILTKRAKRARARGAVVHLLEHDNTCVRVECVGRINIRIGYVSLFKQNGILYCLLTIIRVAVVLAYFLGDTFWLRSIRSTYTLIIPVSSLL